MNKIVLLAVIALCVQLAVAHPEVSLGYRYQPGYSSTGGHLLQLPEANSNNYFSAAPALPVSTGNSAAGSSFKSSGSVNSHGFNDGNGVYGGSGYGALSSSFGDSGVFGGAPKGSSYRADYASGNTQSVHYSQQASNFVGQPPIVTKHFWLHSAPQDYDEQQIVRHINIGQPRKNYNVVFINAPTSNVNKAKIIANIAPVEDKTAIYVLSKKANVLDVSAEVATPAPIINKPEVFFIKYKTPEEAVHAQNTIQAQYDALGGSSDLSNESSIPVSSAIGSLGGSVDSGGEDAADLRSVSVGTPAAVVSNIAVFKMQQSYLPPNNS